MPARQVPRNFCSLSGVFSSRKARRHLTFESALQRDLLALLDADLRVVEILEQPDQVPYLGPDGRIRLYSPAYLVKYHSRTEMDPIITCLVEVVSREQLKNHWASLRENYKAALTYVTARGWKFKILTDKEIRSPKLRWVKIFQRILTSAPDEEREAKILDIIMRQVEKNGWATLETVREEYRNSRWWEWLDGFGHNFYRLMAMGLIVLDEKFPKHLFDRDGVRVCVPKTPISPFFVPLPLPRLWRG